MRLSQQRDSFKWLSIFAGVALLSGLTGYLIAYQQFAIQEEPRLVLKADDNQAGQNRSKDSLALSKPWVSASKKTLKQASTGEPRRHAKEDIAKEALPDTRFTQKIEAIEPALLSIVALFEAGDIEGVAQVKQQLLIMAQSDDAILTELVQSFENLTDSDNDQVIRQELVQVLSNIKDPQVESLAQGLATSGERDEQIAGLELLSQLNMANEQSFDIAVTALSQNSDDPAILQSAMHAIPKMTISSEKNNEVLSQLAALSQHENEAVRSASLFLIAQQAKNGEQLSPLVDALDSKILDEKISAIMAIEQSSVVSPELKAILLTKMGDKSELPEVRAMAANSLNRFSLNAVELDSVNRFKNQPLWNPQH